MRYQRWQFLSLILILFLSTIAATRQSVQSSILGTVKDQGGAVIPDANVVITNTDTGIAASYTSGATGDFQASDRLFLCRQWLQRRREFGTYRPFWQ